MLFLNNVSLLTVAGIKWLHIYTVCRYAVTQDDLNVRISDALQLSNVNMHTIVYIL